MIAPPRIDPPAAPAPRGPGAAKAHGKGAGGPGFEDALRDRQAADDVGDKDAADATPVDGAPALPALPADAGTACSPPQPAPAAMQPALDALLAQIAPPQKLAPTEKAEPPESQGRATAPALATAIDARKLDAGARAGLIDASAGPRVGKPEKEPPLRAGKTAPRVDAPASAAADTGVAVEATRALAVDAPVSDREGAQDAPDTPAPAAVSIDDGKTPLAPKAVAAQTGSADHAARTPERREPALDSSDADARAVAVRNVSTTTHFPIVADPVKQIAQEVLRALDAAAPTGAPAQAPNLNQSVKTLQVQLEPEALGSVTVRMRLSGDQLSVRVDVAEPATLDMIQRERDRLQKSMGSDGVTVGHMEIRALGHAAPAQAGDNAASRQDMNAPGQQQDNQGGGQARTQGEGGDARGRPRDDRRPAPNESSKPHESNHASSNRRGDSRGLYL